MDITSFFGRFHPLIVHLPIGIVVLALCLIFILKKDGLVRSRIVGIVCLIGFFFSLMALASGFMLTSSGHYSPSDVNVHKWMAIGTTTGLLVGWLIWSERIKLTSRVSTAYMIGLLLVMGVTGHFGGNLTHGPEYLVAYAPEPVKDWILPVRQMPEKSSADSVVIYSDLIVPIIENKCVDCHNNDVKQGGLDLSNYDSLLKGGDNGVVVRFGDADGSELYKRITMNPDHEKFMPPSGKTIPFNDIQLIQWWINEKAMDTSRITDLVIPSYISEYLLDEYGLDTRPLAYYEKFQPDSLDDSFFAGAQANDWRVNYLSGTNYALEVTYVGDSLTSEALDYLDQASENVTWLDLSGSKVGELLISRLSAYSNLTRLRLQQNPITDDILSNFPELDHLETLNLYATEITDESVNKLTSYPSLKTLYLWQTNISEEGVASIRQGLPDTRVDLGSALQIVAVDSTKSDSE